VFVEIDPLPAVTEPDLAAADGAPQIYDNVPSNIGSISFGNSETVEAAFARAITSPATLRSNRIVVNAMEPRSAVAQYTRKRALDALCRLPGRVRVSQLCRRSARVKRDKVRVLTDRVGGSFGMKQATYAEYMLLSARANSAAG